ncbi:hypothetical protein ACLVWQ_07400 [Streptomyces sp. CWNU-52B]|uniref:hypothetical protein n=1 Tax=unclassified Streptomyces TaxID=2593676 RepID=UPI0039BFBE90
MAEGNPYGIRHVLSHGIGAGSPFAALDTFASEADLGRGRRRAGMIGVVRAAKDAFSADRPVQSRGRGERGALRVLLATCQGAALGSIAAINQLKNLNCVSAG